MSKEEQEQSKLIISKAGQRGWFFDEFGSHLEAMVKPGGYMAKYRELFRTFYDPQDKYTYSTISRGDDNVERPYLSLLANLTPDDLIKYGSPNGIHLARWIHGTFLIYYSFARA